MNLLSTDLNPSELFQKESPVRFIRNYLRHHFNNKMAVARGNLDYADKLLDELEAMEVTQEENQKKLDAIHDGLREVFDPMYELLEKISAIQDRADDLLEQIETGPDRLDDDSSPSVREAQFETASTYDQSA